MWFILNEGHDFARPENNRDFYGRVEEFLAQHLDGRAEPWRKVEGATAELMMMLLLIDWSWTENGRQVAQIIGAFILALPIAWNRERADRAMGLRTFPLVAMASCGLMALAETEFAGAPDAQARVVQGIITGIGFIGAGAILKQNGDVKGSATAASIWNTGALGAAVALGRYEIAVLLALADFLILRYLTRLKNGK